MHVVDLTIQQDEEEPSAAEVLVQADVDGRPYTFLLDTGAARSSLRLNQHTQSYKAVASATSSGLFGPQSFDVIEVERLKLAGLELAGFQVHRQREASGYRHNLIGMDLLRQHRCLFLFDEGKLILDPDDPVQVEAQFQPLLMDDRGHPYLQPRLGECEAFATWDSGAGVTVVDQGFIEANPNHFEKSGTSQGTDSSGASQPTPMYLMTGAVLGQFEFAAHRAAGVDLSHINRDLERPMDLVLGFTTLRLANWYFDFPQLQWAIVELL